ncbi:MAG: signal peptidase I [Lachnospiraceae bacterium]|nr:signal peptidase I [Lachnospiraceae bacterium]
MKKNLIFLLFILFLTMYVSQNLYQLNLIQGESMYPTYKNMQLTLIDKRSTDFQCGDVVVFYCPSLDCTMVKRIIAAPGQTVLISDGNVLVDGVQSPYVCQYTDFGGTASNELLVGDSQFFVMGDNSARSRDSRYEEIGCVSRENIIGRVIPNRLPVDNTGN